MTQHDMFEDDRLEAALADREAEEMLAEQPEPIAFAGPAPEISADAFALIVRHETGGRAFYEKVIKARPVWPAGSSGVTIGFGYDIGYVAEAELRADWQALGGAALDRLARACGKRGGKTSESELKALVASLADIAVAWEAAQEVFRRRTLPKFAALTAAALPNVATLPPDCFGALVSLTFNRGPSYHAARKPTDTIDRYREMRAIKAAMASGRAAEIPALIRAMIRIWRGGRIETEMTRRRKNEAALFAHGLAPTVTPFVPSFGVGAGDGLDYGVAAIDAAATPGHDDESFADQTEDDLLDSPLSFGTAVSAAAVRWAADADAPDYAHLIEASPPGAAFRLTASTLDALARANAFDPPEGRVLFGLRGCAILSGGESFTTEVALRDLRPDHQTTRCVLGVWDRGGGRIAVFPASTVPNAKAMVDWFTLHNHGNMLPTGLYGYIVGVHNGKPGCFLLRKPGGERRKVVVRRSSADLSYSADDLVDPCTPGDNIHPSFFRNTSGYSSVGCQVVVGMATPAGQHSGPWAAFRKAAGLTSDTGTPGAAFAYMLLTGAEAALAGAGDPPRRLRYGSSGDEVNALQTRLGLAGPDGKFGTNTAVALHAFQRRRAGGRSDGIFTPALDAELGWRVFG